MEKGFEALFGAMERSRRLCPWAKQRTLENVAEDLLNEVKELEHELKTRSAEGMKDELGDVLAMALFFAVLAEEKGYFNAGDSLHNAVEKFRRRKPWIFDEKIKIASAEEAMEKYYCAKRKEKEQKTANARKSKP